MPISTRLDDAVGIVRHTVVTPFDRDEAVRGAAIARDLVLARFAALGPVRLLLDFREMRTPELSAHRAWRDGFIGNAQVLACLARTAILGPDTPQVRAEQATMETETVRFFFDEPSALAWLAGVSPG